MEAGCDNGTGHVEAGHGEGADAMEAGCDNGTGHVEAGHGEGADAMEAGCDNGMGHVGEGEDTMKLAVIMGRVMWKIAMVRGQVVLWMEELKRKGGFKAAMILKAYSMF